MIDIKLLVYKVDGTLVNIRYEDMSDQDKSLLLKIANGIEECEHNFINYISSCGKYKTKRCINCGRSWRSVNSSADR